MFLQNLRAKIGARLNGEGEAGFTLIELLVVMLILGILAAIAIPAFFNQREKATDAQAKSAARTAETAIETYATENGGSYLNATPAILKGIEPTLQTAGPTPSRSRRRLPMNSKLPPRLEPPPPTHSPSPAKRVES